MTIKKSSKNFNPISILSFFACAFSDVLSTGDLFIGCSTIKQHTTEQHRHKKQSRAAQKTVNTGQGRYKRRVDGEGKKEKSK
jgi:hypothetical protein